eukprot:54905-Hanusia_phi.AAC.3
MAAAMPETPTRYGGGAGFSTSSSSSSFRGTAVSSSSGTASVSSVSSSSAASTPHGMLSPAPGSVIGSFAAPRRTSSSEGSQTARAHPPRASMPSAQGRLQASSSCVNRARMSLREVAGGISSKGGGLTLSESIRNNGLVLEEQEQKIRRARRQAHSEGARDANGEFSATGPDLNKRQGAGESERSGKGVGDDDTWAGGRGERSGCESCLLSRCGQIKLLRKQNNEIDKHWRQSSEKNLREEANARDRSSSGDAEKLAAAEQQLRQLRKQVQQGEVEANELKQKLLSMKSELDSRAVDKESHLKAEKAKEKIAVLEKQVLQRENEVKQLKSEISKLRSDLSSSDDKKKSESQVQELSEQVRAANEMMERERQEHKKTAETLMKDLKDAKELLSSEKKCSAELNAAKATLEEKVKESLDLLKASRQQVDNLEKDMELKKQEMDKIVSSMNQKDVIVQENEKLISSLRQQLKEQDKSDLHQQMQNLKDELEKSKLQEKDLQAAMNEAVSSLEENKRRILQLQASLSTAEESLSKAEASMVDMKKKLALLEASDSESLARLCRIRELEAELRTERSLQEEKASLLNQSKETCQELEEKLRRAQQELDDARAKAKNAGIPADVKAKMEELESLKEKNTLQVLSPLPPPPPSSLLTAHSSLFSSPASIPSSLFSHFLAHSRPC